jgi:UDP-4-amino-4,6-dideoxy-N-acetyl-beta-L-altrosamine N-acetyltransferase
MGKNRLKITFRPLSSDDLQYRVKWLNNPHVNRNFGGDGIHKVTNIKKQQTWFSRYLEDKNQKHFVILVNNTPVGQVGLSEVSKGNKHAEVFIIIGNDKYRGIGISQTALQFITNYGFNRLKLHKIFLEVNALNEQAIKAYEKFGFKHEGVLKEHLFYNNKYIDLLYMSIIK